jgi:hypothetical protein
LYSTERFEAFITPGAICAADIMHGLPAFSKRVESR